MPRRRPSASESSPASRTPGPAPMPNEEQLQRLEDIVGNALLARQQFFQKLIDPRRDINDECGYPRDTQAVGVELYRQLYDRECIATRVVQVLPKESWQITPVVFEDDDEEVSTPFEQAWDDLESSLASGSTWHQDEQGSTIWEYLLRADILSGIGHFGVLLLGIDDGLPLQDPVDGVVVTHRRREPITNAQGKVVGFRVGRAEHRSYPDSPPTDKEIEVMNELARQDGCLNSWQPSVPVGNDAWGQPSGSGRQIPGTDQQYAWQGAMPPVSLAGTDQQYFGVQFGGTEVLADRPARPGRRLLFLRAFDESLVQIVRYEWNVRSPRFGMPVMYRITLNDPREQHSGIGLPLATVFVHWSRVIHLADNLSSSEIFGVPRMRPVLNRLLDLRKLYGGSAEMYWRGAFPGVSLETHPQLGGDVNVDVATTRDIMEQYMNGLQRYLLLTGMSARTLAPQVVDPTSQIQVQLEAICIQLGIPVRVFKGSERGELASSQDDASWNDRLRSRQNQYITPRIICPFLDRLIAMGVLPEPEGYSIEWPDLDSLNDRDKAAIALQKTQALAAYVAGQVEAVMPPLDFLTRILGLEAEEAAEILEGAAKALEEEQAQHEVMAQEQGFEPVPPPGFKKPDPEPTEEPPTPVKLRPGETLVKPDGKPLTRVPAEKDDVS